jgi:hypothetical protein
MALMEAGCGVALIATGGRGREWDPHNTHTRARVHTHIYTVSLYSAYAE